MRTSLREKTGRSVADQRIGEREGVFVRPKRVRLEQLERLVEERVADPRDLPGLQERIPEVLPDVAPEIERERPRHCDRQPDSGNRRQRDFSPAEIDHRPILATRRRGWTAATSAMLLGR